MSQQSWECMPIEAAWTSTCQNRLIVAQVGAATLVGSTGMRSLGRETNSKPRNTILTRNQVPTATEKEGCW